MKHINTNLFLFLLGMSIFAISINIFWIGFHSVDLVHNEERFQVIINRITAENNLNPYIIVETDSNFGEDNLKKVYIDGANKMIKGFYFGMLGAFIIGFSFKKG